MRGVRARRGGRALPSMSAMAYRSPGLADDLPDELLDAWNDQIAAALRATDAPESRFFEIDAAKLTDPDVIRGVSWPGDPLEPTKCADVARVVRELSDWGFEGRHALQNEYCEYAVVRRNDASGRSRPKRVQITTELREYWMSIAIHDPERLREIASAALGREVEFGELYGGDPGGMSPEQREVGFATEVAGSAGVERLADAGVPLQPSGALNRENALFMTHDINGVDDMIYIVLFGARRFAVRTPDGFRDATADEIFTDAGLNALACRHADPAAAMGAYGAVLDSKQIAFLDPLGMYLRGFNEDLISIDGAPVPEEWIRWSRGEPGMHQRLELGPGDDDDAFLDNIVFSGGAREEPLTGGHQLVSQIEVGPLIAAVDTEPAAEDEFHWVAEAPRIDCDAAGVCKQARALKRRFEGG
jgi:hypothetical protein